MTTESQIAALWEQSKRLADALGGAYAAKNFKAAELHRVALLDLLDRLTKIYKGERK